VRGAVFDVIIDMRPGSQTFGEWTAVELSAANYTMLYIPGNFAQGFLTYEDNTELFYQVSEFYSPEFERGIRYNDPLLAIPWPGTVEVISTKDRSWPDFSCETIHNGHFKGKTL
jgi:dTDP-4-dehydrorhamnose 3,5-epimerase